MKKIVFSVLVAMLLMNVPTSFAGAGGTSISDIKYYDEYVTVQASFLLITTAEYKVNFVTDDGELYPKNPGEYVLFLNVKNSKSTYPENSTSSLSEKIKLNNPVDGLNTLKVEVIGTDYADTITSAGSTMYEFEFPSSSDEISIEESDGPDLTVTVDSIDYVKKYNKKARKWEKKYKVYFEISNIGNEDAVDPIYVSYQKDASEKTTVVPVTKRGIDAGSSVIKSFYLDKSEAKSVYTITVDPDNLVEELDENNNSVSTTIKKQK